MDEYVIIDYVENMTDIIQYEAYCTYDPIPYSEWYDLTILWMNGEYDGDPYPLDEETAKERAAKRLN